jgi:LPS-assembly protein
MLRRGWLVWWAMAILPLGAQEGGVLPREREPQAADTQTPVPLPELGLDSPELFKPTLPETLQIDNKGSWDATLDGGVKFGGPVKVSGDNGLEIFANRASWDLKDEAVVLEGNVSVYQGNVLQRGERAVYYYNRRYLDSRELTVSTEPIIMQSGKFTVEQVGDKQVFMGTDAGITLHDVEHPNFWVRADRTKVYPGDKVTFDNLKLYVGDVPVFWLPYLSQPLDGELGYHFIPGARSGWGAYILNTYGIMLGGTPDPVTGEREDAWLLSKWHLDLRSMRGAGVGVDLLDTRLGNRENLTGLGLYYAHDLKPDENRTGVPRAPVDPDRYYFELKHRVPFDLPDDATWYAEANVNYLSDPYYLEDFRPDIFRVNPQPDNVAGLLRRDDTSLLSLYARFQANDFQRTATRLPELGFDQSRRPLFGLPVLHEGSTSLGVLAMADDDDLRSQVLEPLLALPQGDAREADYLASLPAQERALVRRIRELPADDPQAVALRDQLLDTGFTRFHTYQAFSMPFTLGGWLNLKPQLGVGYTRYMAVDGPARDESRFHFQAGTEASVKFSKNLGDITNHAWGLDGLLHVLQPYAHWSLLSSDDLPEFYPKVDRLTFSTRSPTLAPERFTATDDMRSWNILRLGTRNHLLTRRDGGSHEWLYMDDYLDVYLDDQDLGRTVSNFHHDMRLQPVPWASAGLETQFPVVDGGSGFNEVSTYLRFLPTRDSELTLGYRWLNNHPVLFDSNRVDARGYLRLSERWGVSAQQSWELDDGTLEYQQYALHRDMGNWVAGVGFTTYDNRTEQNYGVMFSLTLKDLPSISLPFKVDAN